MDSKLKTLGIQRCSLEEGALAEAANWVAEQYRNPVVVSDVNTSAAAPLMKSYTQHVFKTALKPEKKIAEALASQHGGADCFVAVGSGTISDLVKFASYLAGKPYVMIPTAPSMNGYFSITASLIERGKKESHTAHLPAALFADLNILAKAPKRLIRAGVGDAICRPTAQADWLLSHFLLGTDYNAEPFTMQEAAEAKLYDNPQALVRGDKEAIRHLMELLLLGGLGMTMCGGSYPASQGEHMIAHTMEMLYGDQLPETFHGEQIGVTTLVMAQIQEEILNRETLSLPLKELPEKGLTLRKIKKINEKLAKEWSEIRSEIKKVTKTYAEIASVLEAIAAPRTPESLGWRDDWFLTAVASAAPTRNRFTFLDLWG